MTREPTEYVLLRAGLVRPSEVQRALAHQRRVGGSVVEALVALGYVSQQAVLTEVARQLGVPYRDLSHLYVPPEVVALVPERLIRARKVFPIDVAAESRRGPLIVATTAPHDLSVLDEVAFASELQVRAVLASAADIERAIERYLGPSRPAAPRARAAHASPANHPGASASWRGGPVTNVSWLPPVEQPQQPANGAPIALDWTTLRWTA